MNSKLALVSRILLGLTMLVFGLNKLFNFLPEPEGSPAEAVAFFEALIATGYMIKLVALCQVIGGLLLILGKWVPFVIVFLAPITVNILCFHLFLDLSKSMMPALIVTILHLILIYKYKSSFSGLFQ
ncbi:MAG: DoxX family membrane protein [Flavobacteriaceae bacterium]|nr:DoxX family membrane protein [Flavobacteriaceae bacterium]